MKANVNYKGVDLDIVFNYQPYEAEQRDYPGCAEQVEILEIEHNGTCFFELLEDKHEALTDLIYEYLSNE